jgi:hypothetical protein
MPEPIGTYFEVGGTLPASLMEEFLECATDDLDNFQGDGSVEELEAVSGEEPIRFDGNANNGLCNRLSKFCKEHDLTYVTHSEANGECNADTTYWMPGMEYPETFYTDVNNNAIVPFNDISPLVNFMYAVIIDGKEALPKFINDDCNRIKDLVAVGLNKGYPEFLIQLQAAIEEALPKTLIKVPPLVIDHTK